MTVSAVAAELAISKQGAGQIVDDMERRGYVERSPDPSDGRTRLIRLSPRGRKALAAARRFHRRYEQQMIERHGAGPMALVRELLTAMAGAAGGSAAAGRVRPM